MANQSFDMTAGVGSLTSLQNFQLDELSIKQKSEPSYGKKIASYIDTTVNGGVSGYYWARNNRWRINRNYANGRIDMTKFMDLLDFNGKTNYANLSWQCIHLPNRIISGLVGRWMARSEKISVTATDALSINDKKEQYDNIRFFMENREKLEQLQQQSGMQILPKDQEIPADKEELNLWVTQFQRLPEEIKYETGINDVLSANGFYDVNKEKGLHDSAEVGFLGTYTTMDEQGVIHVELVEPENALYSYSKYPDFRDTTWRGMVKSLKISELRRKYGKEFHPNDPLALTEEQLWDIAQTAKDFQYYDKLTWLTQWNVSFMRPYDEWNVDAIFFEVKTVDSEGYTVTETKQNKSTLIQKGARPAKLKDNQEYVEDTNWNIYEGVYLRTTQVLLKWGLKKNMIRPQDPKELGNAEFSYSFYMYQNYDMKNMAVPEKIQEPVDQMILARLKIQQLVAKMRPTGSLINWDALQNIDYGLGEANKTIDPKKLYDQTGDLYYRGTDAEGKPVPVPVTELANAGFLPQMQGLIALYNFHYSVLKDELGEDPNLISQALTPRVTTGNVDAAQESANNATDYMYRAYTNCMEDTGRKISCLLKNSVTYGSTVYRGLLKQDEVAGRIFSTKVQFLPDKQQQAIFEAKLNQAINANQELIMFCDPFQLSRVAQEDVKLAETLFRQAQKKMLLWQAQTAAQNQQATKEAQIESAQEAEKSKQETEKIKGDIDLQRDKVQGETANKTATLALVTSLLSKGEAIPAYLQPLINATVENIMIPLVAENDEMKQQLIQQTKQAMLQEQQEGGSPEQQQEQPQQMETQQPEMAA
jgi:hypothetical protein